MAFVKTDLKECSMKKQFAVANHAPSLLPAHKNWKLVWNDEFDGTELDETKWNFRLNFWGFRSPAFTDQGVEVSNGTLKIHLIRNGNDFCSAHLQTGGLTFDNPRNVRSGKFWPFGPKDPPKFMHKYGYYEIRCKLPHGDGWHSAFWLQSPSIGAHPDPTVSGVECDIMENYLRLKNGTMLCGCGWGGYGAEEHWVGHMEYPYVETEDGWHTYGVDWSRDGYTFYTDGKLIGSQLAPECAVSDVEQFLLVSTECHGYNRVFGNEYDESGNLVQVCCKGKPVPELFDVKLPDFFEVDYVRVFDAVE